MKKYTEKIIPYIQPLFVPDQIRFEQNEKSIISFGKYIEKFPYKVECVFGGWASNDEWWEKITNVIEKSIPPNIVVKIIRFEKNFGKAYVINNLFDQILDRDFDFFLTADSDIIFSLKCPNLFERLLETAIDSPRIIQKPFGFISLQQQGDCRHYSRALTENQYYVQSKFNKKELLTYPNTHDDGKYVGGIAGGCLFVSRKLWEQIGGYKHLGVYTGDDATLLQNAHTLDYSYQVSPNIFIVHPEENDWEYGAWKIKKLSEAPFGLEWFDKDAPATETNKDIEGFDNYWNKKKDSNFSLPSALSPDLDFLEKNQDMQDTNNLTSVAVALHIYHFNVLDKILPYLSNIPYKFDLFINFAEVTNENKENIIKFLKHLKRENPDQNFFFTTSHNRGQDIGGFLVSSYKAEQIKRSYDYICKIHTKSDDTTNLHIHGGSPFGTSLGWRNELIETILGTTARVKDIINIFESQPSIGFISGGRFLTENFTPDENLTKYNFLASKFGLGPECCWPKSPDFLAGTIFWIRGDIWEFLVENKMPLEIFEKGAEQDGLYAHAMERLFVAIMRHLGYGDWYYPPIL
jgi:hypothetical protein